jgi:hypothetical protein
LPTLRQRLGVETPPRVHLSPAVSHLGRCKQTAALIEMATDHLPAMPDAVLVDHATDRHRFAPIRNARVLNQTDVRRLSAVHLFSRRS